MRGLRAIFDLPVIMVTAQKEDVDKIRGLGLGADDYMVKPFSPAELVARVRPHIQIHERLLAQKEMQQTQSITIKDMTILPMERRVFVEEQEIPLTNKGFELLLFFF